MFFTTALQDYTASSAWLEQFGDLWASWLDNTGQGYPEWFALYAGGLKLDIALVPLAADSPASLPELLAGFAHPDVLARGLRLLLDRTSFQGEIPLPHPAQNSSLPSHEEFQRAQGRFWITAAKAAKLIRRGDVWRAKQAVDGELKECLLNMLEWHAYCVYRPGQDTWYDGRALDRWADPRALDALPAVFAVYDSTDMKRALLESMTLFRWLTAELAAALGFPISDDARLYAWLTCRFA